jgi:hypothetical protein
MLAVGRVRRVCHVQAPVCACVRGAGEREWRKGEGAFEWTCVMPL